MSKWTIEVLLVDCTGVKPRRTVVCDGAEDTEMVLTLCQVGARFTLDGYSYCGGKPTADPIARKLVYYCEGYPE